MLKSDRIAKSLRSRPFVDHVLCHFLRRRLRLPVVFLPKLFPDFDDLPVTLRKIPRGGWSTPLRDIVMLLKIVVGQQPKRLMEIGSFRGYTTLLLAQHTDSDAHIVAIDRHPQHGEAYRSTDWERKVERRVGETNSNLFSVDAPGRYDLIFVDADHAYHGVKNDTELVLPLVAPMGYVVWHDYANWGYFDGKNGVPEYLRELASSGLEIAHVAGSDLAIHSPAWNVEGPARDRYLMAIKSPGELNEVGSDPWKFDSIRG